MFLFPLLHPHVASRLRIKKKKKFLKKEGFYYFSLSQVRFTTQGLKRSKAAHMRLKCYCTLWGTEKVNTGSPLLSGLHFILCYVVELVGATDGDEEACSSQFEIFEEKPDQRALSP